MAEMTVEDEMAEMYSLACDAICRTAFGEHFQIDPNDGLRHTSSGSRRIATAVFDALDLW